MIMTKAFLKWNAKILTKWLSENQWSLCYSCIKEAEAENTASVTRASVFFVNKTTRLSFLHTETQNI